jgi:Na+-translocating ferredoxin:NAD+ oxidoreductase RnfD subunit
VDESTRRAAQRFDHFAEQIKIGAAILGGLLIAFAISATLVYLAAVLVARHIYGAESPD